MQKIKMASEQAVLLSIKDSSLHPFFQKYPFLNGNDPIARTAALKSLCGSMVVRNSNSDVEINRLDATDVVWWTDEENRAKQTLRNKGIAEGDVDQLWGEFSWKMLAVPHDAKRILSIGCGGGAELFFLRLRAPNAAIKAVDWSDTISPEFRDVDRVEFSVHDLTNLEDFPDRNFDVIFSNHVIEHMYDPDKVIPQIRKLLAPGGIFVSAMPLDGQGNVGFKDAILKLFKSQQKIGATDALILNCGHPWKTNFSDLNQTLNAAGFVHVDFFQREWSLLRFLPYNDEQRRKKLALAMRLHQAIVRPAQNAAKALFGVNPPMLVIRLFEAFERRIFFGTNRIHRDLSMETVFVARSSH
jgi:SAM-dependent methyltransferase